MTALSPPPPVVECPACGGPRPCSCIAPDLGTDLRRERRRVARRVRGAAA